MGSKSKIEWCESTWNPVKGCSRVSRGCQHCYAERMAARFAQPPFGEVPPNWGGPFYLFAENTKSGPRWTGRVELDESKLELPLHWRKPRRVFVNSMSDLFHEKLPIGDQVRVFRHMLCAPQHEYIILTKRAASMEERVPQIIESICGPDYPMPDCITLGVSAEDQPTADERITHLLRTPAARRIVSLEPLLGPVELGHLFSLCPIHDFRSGFCIGHCPHRRTLDGVIVGGESGPGARPMHPDWVRSIRDQCQEAGVAFFFKQWGEYAPITFDDRHGRAWRTDLWVHPDGTAKRDRAEVRDFAWPMHRLGKKRAGALLDGCEWRDWPCP